MTDYLTPLVNTTDEVPAYTPEPHTFDEVPADTGSAPQLSEFMDAPAAGSKRAAKRPSRAKVSASQVRHILDRYELLAEAHAEHRELLAAALGVDPDIKDLTVHSITAGKSSLASIGSLVDIARQSNPFEATVSAMTLERELARRVWHLLRVLGKVSGPMPGKEAAAGARIAEAAMSLTSDQFAVLTAVERLVG